MCHEYGASVQYFQNCFFLKGIFIFSTKIKFQNGPISMSFCKKHPNESAKRRKFGSTALWKKSSFGAWCCKAQSLGFAHEFGTENDNLEKRPVHVFNFNVSRCNESFLKLFRGQLLG